MTVFERAGGGLATGGVTGATIGSVGGPWGMAIGAVVGTVAGVAANEAAIAKRKKAERLALLQESIALKNAQGETVVSGNSMLIAGGAVIACAALWIFKKRRK